ncbi:MAG: alpha/beta fold hydrolase, partial [Rhodanobacteraceae bacterium]
DCPGEPSSVGEFADFIERYVAERDLRDVVLAGNSLGGAVALECALRRSFPIAGIALLGSGARLRVAPAIFDELERDFAAATGELAELFFARPLPESIARARSRLRQTGQAQVLRDFRACDAFDVTARVHELRVPLLALTGEADRLTPAKFAQFFADRVPGARARILPDAGHLLMIERPAETNAEIGAFVEQFVY